MTLINANSVLLDYNLVKNSHRSVTYLLFKVLVHLRLRLSHQHNSSTQSQVIGRAGGDRQVWHWRSISPAATGQQKRPTKSHGDDDDSITIAATAAGTTAVSADMAPATAAAAAVATGTAATKFRRRNRSSQQTAK